MRLLAPRRRPGHRPHTPPERPPALPNPRDARRWRADRDASAASSLSFTTTTLVTGPAAREEIDMVRVQTRSYDPAHVL